MPGKVRENAGGLASDGIGYLPNMIRCCAAAPPNHIYQPGVGPFSKVTRGDIRRLIVFPELVG